MKALYIRIMLSTCALLSSTNAWSEIAQYPQFLTVDTAPKVMLTMSADHQLFVKAYTDYTDLNKDGLVDTTYTDDIDYFGYFESNQCYKYVSNVFKSQGLAVGTNSHECTATNNWSGNFLNWATMTRVDIIRKTLYGGLRSTDTTSSTILERAYLPNDVHSFVKVFDTSKANMLKFTPFNRNSISICSVTFDNDPSQYLSGKVNTNSPPVIRIAKGKYPRWAASNGNQCRWATTSSTPGSSKRIQYPDPIVRVEVCKNSLTESDCTLYPNGQSKPTGILQENSGEGTKKINFGLMTGSYQKNKSGGVLRKNILPMLGNGNANDEYNATTGVFNTGNKSGIIHSLNKLRIAGWSQSSSSHQYNCNSPGILNFTDGKCIDWGNPLSEIYLETLRYFSGKAAPTPAFNATDTSYIPDLVSQSWLDPISSDQWCADLSTITISTGLNSFDTDQLSNDINLDVTAWTNNLGTAEGISGNYLVGKGTTVDNKRCTAKGVDNLADVEGICPETPSLKGGYHIAGMAYYAHTNDIRPDRAEKQTINTYGVSLAEGLPKFDIPIGGKIVSLLPACEARNNSNTDWRACSLADLRISELNADGTKGAFDMIWEDSSWGNDYDLDGVSHISFCVGNKCDINPGANKLQIKVELREIGAGHGMRFGYVVTGTNDDGFSNPAVHRPAGHANFSYTTNPQLKYKQTKIYTVGTSVAKQLENPLWYMTKYGNFNESSANANSKPDLQPEWDSLPVGNPDGKPDSYFKATNPAELQNSLNQVFASIAAREPTVASISSNGSRLTSDSKVYQPKFNSETWDGQLLAYQLNATTGQVGQLLWDASELIPAHASRKIFSFNSQTSASIPFKHTNLGTVQKSQLSDAEVEYLRGDRTGEGTAYRNRSKVLGDIVNSSPVYTASENFNFAKFTGYSSYLLGTNNAWDKGHRTPMLYVGANDGMLHAFLGKGDAQPCDITVNNCEGEELFSYVPKAIYTNLKQLTTPGYQHHYYVDSTPTHSDAFMDFDASSTDRWGTVLVSTLGAGGKGLFALDISDPMNFTKDDVLWDLDNTDTGMADLGYTFAKASIVKLANGQWGAVLGNGYASANHKAALYIINLETGAVIKKIMAGTEGNSTKPNGLSTPIVIDTNADKIADAVYAGDLYGNLWKFDISDPSSSNWKIAYPTGTNDAPLFKACSADTCTTTNTQPITAKPEVIRAKDGNLIVLFGTGKYFEVEDKLVSSTVNSYYGIKDSGSNVASRSNLQAQSILNVASTEVTTFVTQYRLTSNTKNYTASGWYIDFNDTNYPGERVVANSIVRNGTVIFPTLISDSSPCGQGGTSVLMLLDSQTGSRVLNGSFDFNGDRSITKDDQVRVDTNGDGTVDSTDSSIVASGVISNKGIMNAPVFVGDGAYSAGTDGQKPDDIQTPSAKDTGRMSWTQLK